MGDVKRYEAVHLRYDDNNIRYGEGCEVEVVLASDYEREVRCTIAAGIRMQDKCAALEAELAKLRAELERRAVDGWIPVSERMPQIKQVLSEKCILEGREIPTLYRSGFVLTFDGKQVSAGIVEWFHGKTPFSGVTHWMPLPAAPGAAPSAPKADDPVKAQLLEALERFHNANQARLKLLTSEAYLSMQRLPGMRDALYEMDDAQHQAVAAIAAARQEGGKV